MAADIDDQKLAEARTSVPGMGNMLFREASHVGCAGAPEIISEINTKSASQAEHGSVATTLPVRF